jgi:Protein of unknown function (DUF1552)
MKESQMFISKKHISRRTVLRGVGATLALPLLDAMLPAMTHFSKTALSTESRFVAIEMVHGAAGSTALGRVKNYWSPEKVGTGFDFTPSLKSLEPFRDYITVISNTALRNAMSLRPQDDGPMADHARSSAVFLTGAHPTRSNNYEIRSGPSVDQIYAASMRGKTVIPSLQLCIEDATLSGDCGYGYGCAYAHTISWADAVTPLPMTRAPREVFEKLFPGSGTKHRNRRTGDLLDGFGDASRALKKRLGASDRSKLDDYLDEVREIETRIQSIEKHNSEQPTHEEASTPPSVPESFDDHVELMFDIQLLAFKADLTRVVTFKLGSDRSQRIYPASGVKTPFHTLSHHREQPLKIEEYSTLNAYHVSKAAYFLKRLRETPEGDGNLLDRSVVLYGSPMGDSHFHEHSYLPLFLAGRGNGALRGDQHVWCLQDTPMANVLLTILRRFGVEIDNVGDSTGELAL